MEKERRRQMREQYKRRALVGGVYRVRNTANGRFFMEWDEDIAGAEKRFEASRRMGFTRPDLAAMNADWKQSGGAGFVFEKLEELEMGEMQSRKEFYDDLRCLLELWKDRTDMTDAYKK